MQVPYAAAFVFLLVWLFPYPSAQAKCWITVDGVQQQTTLETSRTIQAATKAYSFRIFPYPYL